MYSLPEYKGVQQKCKFMTFKTQHTLGLLQFYIACVLDCVCIGEINGKNNGVLLVIIMQCASVCVCV